MQALLLTSRYPAIRWSSINQWLKTPGFTFPVIVSSDSSKHYVSYKLLTSSPGFLATIIIFSLVLIMRLDARVDQAAHSSVQLNDNQQTSIYCCRNLYLFVSSWRPEMSGHQPVRSSIQLSTRNFTPGCFLFTPCRLTTASETGGVFNIRVTRFSRSGLIAGSEVEIWLRPVTIWMLFNLLTEKPISYGGSFG